MPGAPPYRRIGITAGVDHPAALIAPLARTALEALERLNGSEGYSPCRTILEKAR